MAEKLKKPEILQMKEDEMTDEQVALYGVVLEEYRYVCVFICASIDMFVMYRYLCYVCVFCMQVQSIDVCVLWIVICVMYVCYVCKYRVQVCMCCV